MRVCCVDGCQASKKRGVELKYFKFPKSKSVRRAWLQAVKCTLKLNSNSLVCSSHFQEADFTIVHGRRTLKKTSVPSLAVDNADPKPNARKEEHTNHEAESSDEESTSDKEDNMSITNDTELIIHNKELADVILSNDSKLDSEEIEPSSENSETIVGDVLVNDVSSELVIKNKASDSLGNCENAISKSVAKVNAEVGVEINEMDVCSRRNSESDPSQAEVNGCDPITDPLSCLNGDLEPVTPTEPPTITPEVTKPLPESNLPPPGREKTPPESEKPLLDPDKVTDIEKLLDSEHPPAVIKNVIEKPASEPELTVLDPKTGLMREERNSIESIEDSCESLGESTEEGLRLAEPVFVEISVDPDNIGTPSPPDSPTDCMMIVENVQVDIDPNMLLMMEHGDEEPKEGGENRGGGERREDDDDVQVLEKKPEDPVSLLTSSDEDDVILQEPHIDCVSVSDETDEDDQPLTRLLRDARKKKAQVKKVTDILERRLNEIFWGTGHEFYCYVCSFTTKSKTALASHAKTHAPPPGPGEPGHKPPSLSFNVCSVCSFQTPSRRQFASHVRKHREEKKFQCNLCEYRARHKMSLVYHVKSIHMSAMDSNPEPEKRSAARRSGSKVKTKKKSPRKPRKDDDEYIPGSAV